jgi:type II secretory pathway component GspD/PulD (secretin)
VRARHGLPALVTSGTTMNYIRELTRESDDNGVTISTETASAFEGVMLGVVPFLRDDGSVDLEIFPITSKVDLSNKATFVDQSEVTLPKVDVRNVSTNVRARNGDTIILGGLIFRDSSKGDRGVPALAEVPGLGWLFGRRADSETTRELVVVMHIRVAP